MSYLPREGAPGKDVVHIFRLLVAEQTEGMMGEASPGQTISRPAFALEGQPHEGLDL